MSTEDIDLIVELDDAGRLIAQRPSGKRMGPRDVNLVCGMYKRGAWHASEMYLQETEAHKMTLAAYERAELERDALATANAALLRDIAHLRSRTNLYRNRLDRLYVLAREGAPASVFHELLLSDTTDEERKGDP